MKFKKFRNLDISKIGFGCWGIGGDAYGKVDDKESIKALEFAFDQGVNFFDTADIYGNGHSEHLLGKVFKRKRNKVILTSKVGYKSYWQKIQEFSERHIRKAIEKSLKNLKTDYIDIYFLHSPTRDILYQDYPFETLTRLKEEGKIRFCGVSVKKADDGLITLNNDSVDAIQVSLNLLDQSARKNGLITLAAQKEKGLVVKTPLFFGFLTSKYDFNTEFQKNDHRSRWSKEQRNNWIQSTKKFSFLCENNLRTMTQAALRFCLSHQGVSTVIPGMKNTQQVKENVDSIHVPPFSGEEWERIENIYLNELYLS